MISLRQHIFSLVAVFVALAIGIAAGSTVVRGPLLDSTRARLEAAEANIEIERAENERLAAELAQLDAWAVDGPGQLLAGRLADEAVLVVVAGDVDEDVVRGVTRSIGASAATLLGEIRVDPVAFDPEQADRVAAALPAMEAAPDDPTARLGLQIRQLIELVVDQLRQDPAVHPDQLLRSMFGALEDAGLVDLLALNVLQLDVEEVSVLVLVDRNVAFDPAPLLDEVVALSDPDGAAVPVLVAEVGRVLASNEEPVPSYVAAIRRDGRLRDEVSTVDNAETILGWVAILLGLEALEDGPPVHLGFRDGAERPIPPRAL